MPALLEPARTCPRPRRGRRRVRGDRRAGRADPRHGAVSYPFTPIRSIPAFARAGRTRPPLQAERAAPCRRADRPDLRRGSEGARIDRRQGDGPHPALAPIFFARPKSFAARAHRWLWYRRPYKRLDRAGSGPENAFRLSMAKPSGERESTWRNRVWARGCAMSSTRPWRPARSP